jgi:uncharacterized membrane protein
MDAIVGAMMQRTKSPRRHFLSQNGITLVLALALALGIFFRFTHLDHQVYWHDENFTSLRISGYNAIEVNQELFNGKVVGLEALQKYQQPNPNKTIVDTVRSLAIDDSQHPPIYYVFARQWAVIFGPSVTAVRSLSVVFSLLMFPSMYWLCQELFAEGGKAAAQRQSANLISGIAIALLALSPFQVLYAQEAREYSLWSVITLLCGAALLRAMGINTLGTWGLFTVLLTFGLYTQPMMLLVAIAFTLYLLIVERFRINRVTVLGVLSFALAMLAFSPWLNIIAKNWSQTGANWTAIPIPLPILLKTWGLHLLRMFILTESDFGFDHWTTYVGLPLLLLLVGTAFYHLYRQTPLRTWLFVVALTLSAFLPLGLMDLVLGGQRSVSSRYIVPFYVGLPVAIAYLLAHNLLEWQQSLKGVTTRGVTTVQSKRWQGITALLLSISLLACVFNAQSNTAWTKGINYNLLTVAKLINAAPHPLLVSNSFGIDFGTTFALGRRLDSKVKLLLTQDIVEPNVKKLPSITTGFDSIFLLNPSDAYRQKLEQQIQGKTKLVFKDFHLSLWNMD